MKEIPLIRRSAFQQWPLCSLRLRLNRRHALQRCHGPIQFLGQGVGLDRTERVGQRPVIPERAVWPAVEALPECLTVLPIVSLSNLTQTTSSINEHAPEQKYISIISPTRWA